MQEASKSAKFFKRNMKKNAAKELTELLIEYQNAAAEPDKIVKHAGYWNVAAFTKVYEKNPAGCWRKCRRLESQAVRICKGLRLTRA